MKRKKELQNRIDSAEPYSSWYCKDHETMGSGGTSPFACCQEELDKIRGFCSSCGADFPSKNE